jgi:hypothetical protein
MVGIPKRLPIICIFGVIVRLKPGTELQTWKFVVMKRNYRVLLFLFAGLLVIAGFPHFLPETVSIQKEISAEVSPRIIYTQVNDLRNWIFWSAWHKTDSFEEAVYRNGGIGRGGQVTLQQAGKPEKYLTATIVNAVPYRSLEVAFDFQTRPFTVNRIEISENDEVTLISWSMGFKNEGWKSLFLRWKMANELERSLKGLLHVSGLHADNDMLLVEPGTIDAFPFVSIRRQIPYETLSEEMGLLYTILAESSEEGNYTIIGHPFAVYHSVGEERVDVECGFPTDTVAADFGFIRGGVFEETKCAILDFTGDYSRLEEGHAAIQDWIIAREFRLNGPPVEIYMTQESDTADSSRWHTRICYPVEY